MDNNTCKAFPISETFAKPVQTKRFIIFTNLKQELQKTYYEDNHLMETTDYSGMFIHKDGHIDYIQTSEGRMKRDAHDHLFYAEYFINDHLRNVRDVILTNSNYSNSIIQVTDDYLDRDDDFISPRRW